MVVDFAQMQKGERMNDLISRQAAIAEIMEDIEDKSLHDDPATPKDYAEGYDEGIRNAAARVLQMPTVTPEQKKGEWVKEYWNGEHTRKCSACNITQTVTTYRGKVNFNFCPYCGADMRGNRNG